MVRKLPCRLYSISSYHLYFIFDIYVHCHKIVRCILGDSSISCKSNYLFNMNNCFCIKIPRIYNGFFRNFFSFNRLFNFVIDLIWLFCTVPKITNCFFILPIGILRNFYLSIQNFRIWKSFFRHLLCGNRFFCFSIITLCRSYLFFIQPFRIWRNFFCYIIYVNWLFYFFINI